MAASPQFLKSALRDLLSVSYDMKSITSISHLRWLPPFWWLAPPPFPRKRGHYKAPLCGELLMKGLLCGALLSHRPAGGRWCRKAPKGGHFQRPQGGCMVFAAKGGIRNGARRRRTSPAQRYYITPEGESPQPACKASADHRQNPWRPGPKARRRHQPSRP